MRESAQLFQPHVPFLQHFGDRMARKHLRRYSLSRSFPGDGFGAVLTKLGHLPLAIGIGPRAAGAIETVLLIDLQQRLKGPFDSHFLEAKVGCLVNGAESGRRRVSVTLVSALCFERRLRALDSLRQMGGWISRAFLAFRLIRGTVFV